MLDCNGSHGQGSKFLELTLDSILNPGDIKAAFQALKARGGAYHTRTEKSYDRLDGDDENNHQLYDRLDIEIQGADFLLYIEVKINAPETGDQLRRYYERCQLQSNAKGRLLYLTRSFKPPREGGLKDAISCVNWKTLSKKFLQHIDAVAPKDSFSHGLTPVKQLCEQMARL